MIAFVIVTIVVAVLYGLLLEGIHRKLRARLQWRRGPPIIQPFIDVIKLMGKEVMYPEGTSFLFLAAPPMALALVLLAATLIPLGSLHPLSFSGDLLVVLFLLSAPPIFLLIGGAASRSPYGQVGASRLLQQLIAFETPFFASTLVPAILRQSFDLSSIYATTSLCLSWLLPLLIAATAYYLAAIAKLLQTPFSAPLAEGEILEGPLTEYSGFPLALFKVAHAVELYAVAALFNVLFVPLCPEPVLYCAIASGLVPLLFTIGVTLLEVLTARLRPDQTASWLVKWAWSLALLALMLSIILRFSS